MSRPVVAAVCYRCRDRRLEFLLVRTTGGKYWTFPKGHVESRERPWVAAKREASEEAGVRGTIETKPFTRYTYSKGGKSGEDVVAAFLLLVQSENGPAESQREPQWFSPEQAIKQLARGRREKYMREHERVIGEAVSRISQHRHRRTRSDILR